MRKKQVLSLIAALGLTVGLLAGCGNSQSDAEGNNVAVSEESGDAGQAGGDNLPVDESGNQPDNYHAGRRHGYG